MPVYQCECCGGPLHWSWEEAFDKFGFNDGDGVIETWRVEEVLTREGYTVVAEPWSCHNTVIQSLTKDGQELIPHENPDFMAGYTDPRTYLPPQLIELLDREYPGSKP